MTAPRRAFGRLPAAPFLAGFFALAILVGLTFGDAAPWVGVALFAVLILHCVARPTGGWDVFLTAAFPSAIATLLHDLAGTPRRLGLLLIPFAILLARTADRERPA